MDRSPDNDLNKNFAFDSLQTIRNRLLDLTGRNRLLNFRYGKSGAATEPKHKKLNRHEIAPRAV
ncbi:hypothetical protein MAH1_22690 [Sessilibacter sp. MAH1]